MDRRTFVAQSALAASGAVAVATGAAATSTKGSSARKWRRIATEEAFSTPEQLQAMVPLTHAVSTDHDVQMWEGRTPDSDIVRRLDLEGDRLRIMDENGVSVHLLSLTSPGVQCLDADTAVALAQSSNDRLAAVIRKYPGRFAGLAAFAPQDPKRAVREMERAIRELGLNGFISNSHTNGEYMDDPKYWPILEAAESLGLPIYIHPRSPNEAMLHYYGDLNLNRAMWGYHTETSLHAMRLIMSGMFERFPKLNIVLGHMGEGIPFFLWRMDKRYHPQRAPLKRKPSEYFRENFYITTSGVNSHPPLKYCLEVLGPDRILWAIDYPYEDSAESVQFMDSAPISDEVKEKIYFRNAERIFRIKA